MMEPTPPPGLPAVTLTLRMGDYTVLRHGYVGDPVVYTIYRADNTLCSSAVSWAEVDPTIATDMRQAGREPDQNPQRDGQ